MPPVDMDADIAAAQFKRLSRTGARLAIEVRGRANEFLRTVDPFPFDEIKTGGASILRFARTVRGPGLSAIADLLDIANKANAAITAVGVEDQTSLAALRGLGFTAAQGNHLAKVGDLKDFKPSKVNDVRALLKLEALDPDSLNALFRSAAPGAQAGVLSSTPAAGEAATEEQSDAAEEEERRAKAREKARKLALAKRAKMREARKTAAIKRVKAKAAAQSSLPGLDFEEAFAEDLDPFGPSQAPRDLQERIAKEFGQQESGDDAPAEASPLSSSTPEQNTKDVAQAQASTEFENAPQASKTPPTKTSAQKAQGKSESAPKRASTLKAQKAALAERSKTDRSNKDEPNKPAASLMDIASDKEKSQTTPSTPKPMSEMKMPVSKAGARFLPEIRVASPSYPGGPARVLQSPASTAAKGAVTPIIVDTERPAPQPTIEPVVDEKTAAALEEPVFAAPPRNRHTDDDIPLGDLHRTEEEEETETPQPSRKVKRKNFLTRKYQIMPTHFWPKSWKRRYRAMKAKNAAARQDGELGKAPATH